MSLTLTNFAFSAQCLLTVLNSKFHEIQFSGSTVVHVDRRTDVMKIRVALETNKKNQSTIVHFSVVLVTVSAGDDSFPVCVLSPVDWHSLCITMHFFTFSQDTVVLATQPSTGRCVLLHLAMLQMSRWLYRTHCRDTPRALALVSKSGSLMTCVRQRMTDCICQTLPSLLGKECELLFKQNGGYFMM